jgi:hypothetical protein
VTWQLKDWNAGAIASYWQINTAPWQQICKQQQRSCWKWCSLCGSF